MKKKRLDQLLREHYPTFSRTQIQSWIMQGKVTVDDEVVTKAGVQVPSDAKIILNVQEPKYVSRAGAKLEYAFKYFDVSVMDKVVLDAGLSTGGFTDCLLQHGARKVYGVDVGYGQVHERIRNDERVVVLERTNLRHMTANDLSEKVDLVTLDLSFISLLKVIGAVSLLLKPKGELITLIKPQFEALRQQVGRGGLVTDAIIHQEVIKKVTTGIQKHGYALVGVTQSPVEGAGGNKEFLAYFRRIA